MKLGASAANSGSPPGPQYRGGAGGAYPGGAAGGGLGADSESVPAFALHPSGAHYVPIDIHAPGIRNHIAQYTDNAGGGVGVCGGGGGGSPPDSAEAGKNAVPPYHLVSIPVRFGGPAVRVDTSHVAANESSPVPNVSPTQSGSTSPSRYGNNGANNNNSSNSIADAVLAHYGNRYAPYSNNNNNLFGNNAAMALRRQPPFCNGGGRDGVFAQTPSSSSSSSAFLTVPYVSRYRYPGNQPHHQGYVQQTAYPTYMYPHNSP